MDWKKFFDSLGLNGTRWQWRIERWKRDWTAWKESLTARKPQISEKHKFCSKCQALLKRDETECARCGAKAPNWHAQSAGRAITGLLPSTWPATTILMVLVLMIGATQMFKAVYGQLVLAGCFNLGWAVENREYGRFITNIFFHYGFMHLGFNGLALFQVGPMVEKEIGSKRFFVIYLLTGIIATLVHAPFGGRLAGASGALFGLIGFGVAYSHFYGGAQGKAMRNFFLMWAVYGFIFGLVMHAANWAHLGGCLGGLAFGAIVAKEGRYKEKLEPVWTGLMYVLIVAVIASFVQMVFIYRGLPPPRFQIH